MTRPGIGKKAAARRTTGRGAFEVPNCCPFRHSNGKISGYAMVWTILYHHRKDGIHKSDLLAKYQRWSRKSRRLCGYDLQVVSSPTKEGDSNPSARTASHSYWVERQGERLRLHLVSEPKE